MHPRRLLLPAVLIGAASRAGDLDSSEDAVLESSQIAASSRYIQRYEKKGRFTDAIGKVQQRTNDMFRGICLDET